jgi:hypothetical protein
MGRDGAIRPKLRLGTSALHMKRTRFAAHDEPVCDQIPPKTVNPVSSILIQRRVNGE